MKTDWEKIKYWDEKEWHNVPADISQYQGFIYIITNLVTGQKYVGKKFFKFKKTKKPLKGKSNKRHYVIESDWKDYYGSNAELLKDIKLLGKHNFKREIIDCYKNKFDCAYNETKLQFELNVLFDNSYYNEIISCRLRRKK